MSFGVFFFCGTTCKEVDPTVTAQRRGWTRIMKTHEQTHCSTRTPTRNRSIATTMMRTMGKEKCWKRTRNKTNAMENSSQVASRIWGFGPSESSASWDPLSGAHERSGEEPSYCARPGHHVLHVEPTIRSVAAAQDSKILLRTLNWR